MFQEDGTALATSKPVGFAIPNEITQVHLAHSSNISETVVMWASADSSDNVVQWGPAPDSLIYWAMAKTTTYTIADMCDAPANTTESWWSPGAIFTGACPSHGCLGRWR